MRKNAKFVASMLLLFISGIACAAETPDEDERLDNGLRDYGYVTGQAYQCVADENKKAAVSTALEIATGILRLFGSDRAFYFATAFGIGSAEAVDAEKCPELIEQYHQMTAKLKTLAGK